MRSYTESPCLPWLHVKSCELPRLSVCRLSASILFVLPGFQFPVFGSGSFIYSYIAPEKFHLQGKIRAFQSYSGIGDIGFHFVSELSWSKVEMHGTLSGSYIITAFRKYYLSTVAEGAVQCPLLWSTLTSKYTQIILEHSGPIKLVSC